MQDQLSLSSLPAEVFELMQFLSNPSLGHVETFCNFSRVVFFWLHNT